MSIVHDVMDRNSQICKHDEGHKPPGRKRRRETMSSNGRSKRPKTRAYVAQKRANEIERHKTYDVRHFPQSTIRLLIYLVQIVKNEACNRDILLVRLHYGVHNSPAPASFLREGTSLSTSEQTYTPHQYVVLDVASEIAAGATGVVHNATLQVLTASDGI
jgi:hypothetical protein